MMGVLAVKATGLPFEQNGKPSTDPHFPVSVALAYPTANGWEAWSSVVGITRVVAQRRDIVHALTFAGLTLDALRGAPQPSEVAAQLHALIATRGIKTLAAWQASFVLHFLAGDPWGLGTMFPRVLDVSNGIGRNAPPGCFTSTKPSIAEASAFVSGALHKGILPPDRTAASMAIQVAHIAAEAQRLAIIARKQQESANVR